MELLNLYVTRPDEWDMFGGERKAPHLGRRVALGWDDKHGARFHIWYWIDTDHIEGDVIYKNPPLGAKHNDKAGGYFPTRKLDATKQGNAATIKAAIAECKRALLFDMAFAERDEERRAQDQEAAAFAVKYDHIASRVPLRVAAYDPRAVLDSKGLPFAACITETGAEWIVELVNARVRT